MNKDHNNEEFICEQIKPVPSTLDTSSMSFGEPGFPGRFIWRKQEYKLAKILDKWKESGPCRNGSNERYLRRHWFHIITTDDIEMKIFFERQAKSKREIKKRWWLDTIIRQDS